MEQLSPREQSLIFNNCMAICQEATQLLNVNEKTYPAEELIEYLEDKVEQIIRSVGEIHEISTELKKKTGYKKSQY